jgi:hypothetical protein
MSVAIQFTCIFSFDCLVTFVLFFVLTICQLVVITLDTEDKDASIDAAILHFMLSPSLAQF